MSDVTQKGYGRAVTEKRQLRWRNRLVFLVRGRGGGKHLAFPDNKNLGSKLIIVQKIQLILSDKIGSTNSGDNSQFIESICKKCKQQKADHVFIFFWYYLLLIDFLILKKQFIFLSSNALRYKID